MLSDKTFLFVSESLKALYDWLAKTESTEESHPLELATEDMQKANIWIQVSFETELDNESCKHLFFELRNESGESYEQQTVLLDSETNEEAAATIAYLLGYAYAMQKARQRRI